MHTRSLDEDPNDERIELSVVIPCLNEAETIGGCVDAAFRGIREAGVVGEVVVADNGSEDGSGEIAARYGARVVLATERGYCGAIRGGVAQARGRFVIMGDADGEHDLSLLTPFLERLRYGDELVVGNRFRGGIMPGSMSWTHRYVGTPVLTAVLNLAFRSGLGDSHCGLRGFPKAAFEALSLSASGMEFASEMIVNACIQKRRISEVPVVQHRSGRRRPSHLRSVRDGLRHLRIIFGLLFKAKNKAIEPRRGVR